MPQPDDRFRPVLNLFVYRARRIEAHSIATDKSVLQKLVDMPLKFQIEHHGEEKKLFLIRDFPPEEAMESLAGRCRPFLLDRDPMHYVKILKAIGYFLQEDPELSTAIAQEFKLWKKLRRDEKEPLGYTSSAGVIGGVRGPYVNDRELAYRWLYGDLVHAEDTTDLDHELTARFEAGALLTAHVAFRSINVLNIVRTARDRDLITLDESAFNQEVAARTSRRAEARLVSAPSGHPMEFAVNPVDATHDRSDGGGV